jgi:hypothetical protein
MTLILYEVSVCHELTLFVCKKPFGTDYEIIRQEKYCLTYKTNENGTIKRKSAGR